MKKLEGKIALVTGSSRGLGKEMALRMAQEGADILVTYQYQFGSGRCYSKSN